MADHVNGAVPVNGGSSFASSSTAEAILAHPRHAYARAILGDDLFQRLAHAKILVVGAGGIGCELLKNLVLVGFGHVEVIDLDTIDLSNLNRQFLFQKVHIGKAKSLVAATTARNFNPLIDIQPFHANVKDTQRFGWEYFAGFDVVCNALDNLDARRWVNRMCIMTGIPLVESGTTGFLGQVQPIARGASECYDCTAKPTPRSYPVCTIRSTPSTPIHCIVWAKTYLFSQLFGPAEENEDAELDKALQEGENAAEIANLRKEGQEMRLLRDAVFGAGEAGDEANLLELSKRIFNKVFQADVERLLSMDEMWQNRTRPVPLDFDQAGKGESSADQAATSTLRDQRLLSLDETVAQFADSLTRLSRRARQVPTGESLSFDKDDQDAMDFVTATANLRSRVYHIPPQTRFQVKEMAGNIIPAIASTNAIIAGAQVLQTLHALRRTWREARFVSLNKMGTGRLLSSIALGTPNPECGVCQDDYVRATVDMATATLGDIRQAVLASREEGGVGYEVEGLELYEGARLLADEDFDDNLDTTLTALGIKAGSTITCADEDGKRAVLNVYLSAVAEGNTAAKKVDFGPAEDLPTLRMKPTLKRPHDESDEEDEVLMVDAKDLQKAPLKRARAEEGEGEGVVSKNATDKQVDETNKRPRLSAPQTGAKEEEAIELD